MKTSDYIKKFNLDQEDGNFNKEEFLKDLEKEFLERIQITKIARESTAYNFRYHDFQILVKELQDKFWAISNKKKGKPFSFGFFSAMYAIVIVKAREKYFPEEQERITQNRIRKQQMIEAKKRETMECTGHSHPFMGRFIYEEDF